MIIKRLRMCPPPYSFRKHPIRIGLVGGAGGFFGPVLFDAARLSGAVEVVACALHQDRETALAAGKEWGIPNPFGNIEEMAIAAKKPGLELDGVIVATMNSQHRAHCEMFLDCSVHVFCEKPLTAEPEDAPPLVKRQRELNLEGGQNFTYLGNATWYKAAYMVQEGAIGEVRKVEATYPQGWLSDPLGVWREKREFSGPFGSLQDIGVHCLASLVFLTGEPIARVCCRTTTHVSGREVEDDGSIEGFTKSGIPNVVRTTQVDASGINDHSVKVIGSDGTIRVSQLDTEELVFDAPDTGKITLYRGQDYGLHAILAEFFHEQAEEDAVWRSLPGHHPPGLYGAIAHNIRQWAIAIQRRRDGVVAPDCFTYPDFELGGHLMMVLGAAKESVDHGGGYIPVDKI